MVPAGQDAIPAMQNKCTSYGRSVLQVHSTNPVTLAVMMAIKTADLVGLAGRSEGNGWGQ
jgi:hypothetical protein